MTGGPAFTDREVFTELIGSIRTADGREYQDVRTIYGDMSRLVVAWLAATPPAEINRAYNQLGWGGAANGRALHEAAQEWMGRYRAEGE
jgi:hypothetical protein